MTLDKFLLKILGQKIEIIFNKPQLNSPDTAIIIVEYIEVIKILHLYAVDFKVFILEMKKKYKKGKYYSPT